MSELAQLLGYGAGRRPCCALLVIDIDNFKVVNESLGHAVGDKHLKRVGQVLRAVTGETALVARIGSDEFVVVLPDAAEPRAVEVAEKVRMGLHGGTPDTSIHVSVGVAALDGASAVTAEAALACADIAVYEAKTAGGDQIVVYRPTTTSALSWARRIRAAITSGRFVLHEQPILDLRSGAVWCHELLIRMLDDAGQLILPGDFIPEAERFGLIGEIDRWVTGHALERAKSGRCVTINISAQSLTDRAIVTAVQEAVSSGLDPRNVIFEITETAPVLNTVEAVRLAEALAELGCDLALDDFGTGFGSLTNLKHFPARFLKIDASFVRDARVDETDCEIVRLICETAHALGKETIAEGVEGKETLRLLRRHGVDHVQGFFIGQPEPIGATAPPECRARTLKSSRDSDTSTRNA